MGNYPYLVNIVWEVINKFIEDWQTNPYRWPYERDIQVEIASRINLAYKIIGKDTIKANYKDALPGFENNQIWGRVCCDPTLTYTYKSKKEKCRPDIVVWDNIKDPDKPPDEKPGFNYPVLWLCEIKLDGSKQNDWDVEKIKFLLNQDISKYACWLRLNQKSRKNLDWDNPNDDQRLWIYRERSTSFK